MLSRREGGREADLLLADRASLFSQNGGRLSNTSASTSFGTLSSSAPGPALLQSIPQAEEVPLPSPGMSQTLIDIERRLDADRTIDLFTMNPRVRPRLCLILQ